MKYVVNKICIDKWRFTNKVVLVESDIIEHVLKLYYYRGQSFKVLSKCYWKLNLLLVVTSKFERTREIDTWKLIFVATASILRRYFNDVKNDVSATLRNGQKMSRQKGRRCWTRQTKIRCVDSFETSRLKTTGLMPQTFYERNLQS